MLTASTAETNPACGRLRPPPIGDVGRKVLCSLGGPQIRSTVAEEASKPASRDRGSRPAPDRGRPRKGGGPTSSRRAEAHKGRARPAGFRGGAGRGGEREGERGGRPARGRGGAPRRGRIEADPRRGSPHLGDAPAQGRGGPPRC